MTTKTIKDSILAVLKRNKNALTPMEIASKGKLNYNSVRRTIRELLRKYEVNAIDGRYWLGLNLPRNLSI
jgi:DNA-binding IclR family transcriptional regulator